MAETSTYANFGLHYAYFWGNLPAVDYLNLPENEGTTRDFKICFAASGDLCNLARTISSLPAGYEGQCDVLSNYFDTLVVGHNVVILWALLNPNPNPAENEAVELATHLMYSSMLTPALAEFLSESLDIVHDLAYGSATSITVNDRGTMEAALAPGNLNVTKEMLQAKYSQRVVIQAYSSVMCSPERQDYTDRFLNGLEAGHRLSFLHHRASEILPPFSLNGWDMSLAFPIEILLETSNLADYNSAPSILRDWAPFLNHDNKLAAILHPVIAEKHAHNKESVKNHGSSIVSTFIVLSDKMSLTYFLHKGVDVERMMTAEGINSSLPDMIRFYAVMAAFLDDHDKFQSFLCDQNIKKIAASCGLKLWNIIWVHTKRAGGAAGINMHRHTIETYKVRVLQHL
ncbi:hypothetical protein DXG01_013495 [Tephrocybe rancida]|nr:hypothetical protein DXG01_013495 [Tephrocybe rancida]